ncbi:MAG: MFS transporter [Bryobacterales bacterium]|nr:MFS transporter [Bryobacterales bacterium]
MRIPGFRWWIAILLFGASALSFFDRQVLSVLAPAILKDLEITNREYSYAVSAFTLAYSVMFTVGGRIIDRIGTRLGLGLTVAFWTLASLLHAVAQNAAQLTGYRLMLGIGEGGCFPGAAKGILEWFPAHERALAMGIATTGGSAFGAVLAPPLIVLASQLVGWRGAFIATGLIGVAWVLLWFLFFRSPESSTHVRHEERAMILAERGKPGTASEVAWPWAALLGSREVWGLVATRFLLDPVFYFYMFWIPQYLSEERGASLEDIGRVAWIPFLTLGISSMLGGALSDALVRRGFTINRARKGIMAAAALLTPVSILALVTPNLTAAVALLGVLMFAHGFWMTNYMTMIGDLFPSSTVGTVVGLSGTAGGLGGFLSTLLIGQTISIVGYGPMFLICGLLYPVGFAILALSIPRLQRLEKPLLAG